MNPVTWCRIHSVRKSLTRSCHHGNDISRPRLSEIKIQLLSESLHKQIFKTSSSNPASSLQKEKSDIKEDNSVLVADKVRKSGDSSEKFAANQKLEKVAGHLKKHGLWDKETVVGQNVDFQLPPLLGDNVADHFIKLGQQQVEDYVQLADRLKLAPIPAMPSKWTFVEGWTRYNKDGTTTLVDYPEDSALVFDVETVVTEGSYPTMATAVSDKHWYSWSSDYLVNDRFRWSQVIHIDDLIPLETGSRSQGQQGSSPSRLVVGHNVGFDRSFVKEQYYIKKSKLRFMDTMSLHIAVCGLTNFQRVLYRAGQKDSKIKKVEEYREKQRQRRQFVIENWKEVVSLNDLADVHALHVGDCQLDKDIRMKKFNTFTPSDALRWRSQIKYTLIRQLLRSCLIRIEDWKEVSSLNNLADVHALHVGGRLLDKDIRKTFVEGSTADVRQNFQELMTYCANDVVATLEVFKCLWNEFQDRFPHPVTLAGMLEMGTGYLPVNQNWERYVHQSNAVYEDMQRESKQLLMSLANDACQLLKNDRYKEDPWLWDLDWSSKYFKITKAKPPPKRKAVEETETDAEEDENCVDRVLKVQERHYKRGNTLCGYPGWYRTICRNLTDEDWAPGPCDISSQTRTTPKLLRLTWDGFPVHYDADHGWGYLVPGRKDNLVSPDEDLTVAPKERQFPYESLKEIMLSEDEETHSSSDHEEEREPVEITSEELEAALLEKYSRISRGGGSGVEDGEIPMDEVMKLLVDFETKKKREKALKKPKKVKGKGMELPEHVGDGPHNSVNIPGCWFYKIPHKDGKGKRVGNPLAKDYLMHMEDGTLAARSGEAAGRVLRLNKMFSYWKNNQKRIESQMLVWLSEKELPESVKSSAHYEEAATSVGAIVPRIVPAGTITRRAVEKTWLTASNAYEDRVGSELKSMIQSPPGYCFVGADVDSQELWIGAILGDSMFGSSHGCTALGWMTLQGNKKDKTDLHSVVAETVGVSRDHAKVFNYGRIYGAGQNYAEKLLLQFNHRLTIEEARQKAKLMFATTKGKRDRQTGRWSGGSESYMFNKLEEIARSDQPRTPVLGCRISKALEPENVNEDFMTSRINWVVQSSAVDYLHLMLVCMRWLLDEYNIDGRFSISIHDEVRYLVAEEDRYRAALALQIANLLTRAIFAYRLGIHDLPQSVAFFNAVDIDRCLRKEVDMRCETPSNIHGMERGYQIPNGEALNVHQILKVTNGCLKKKPVVMEVTDSVVNDETDTAEEDHRFAESVGTAV